MHFSDFIPILQTAIGPVIFINAVGTVMNAMHTRLGRIVDHARTLAEHIRKGSSRREALMEELHIYQKRAHRVRLSIALATGSTLLAALMISTIFLFALLHFETVVFLAVLFIACMVTLTISLILFIRDTNHVLEALEVEIRVDTLDSKNIEK